MIHNENDTDGGPKAIHHTLGSGPTQAAPGNHTHDGGSSATIPELEALQAQYIALEARVYALEHP